MHCVVVFVCILYACVCACMSCGVCACVMRACVCACVRACLRASVRVCSFVCAPTLFRWSTYDSSQRCMFVVVNDGGIVIFCGETCTMW